MTKPHMITMDDPSAELCTTGGVEHDYRVVTYSAYPGARLRASLRCVWCHVVACGDADETDPCVEPYHHEPRSHRTRLGRTWPIGGGPDA